MTSQASQWPFTAARSTPISPTSSNTTTQTHPLLPSLLAAAHLDELSSADAYAAIASYVRTQGRSTSTSTPEHTTVGLTFWVYPTGLKGPYHVTDEGEVKQHGVLMTVERGASVDEVVRRAREALEGVIALDEGGVGHEHVAKA
ncbi:hypothetical protein EIP91_006753 [Steccherinum ochraceum]|uniref:Uncharacterized protein n=1 Tax=Steccherinum ochraceum TaxID=92696 RepID=A0A4R0RFU9_9APHY|nr:hypothetical protein EIP91_006753 [Steccherinum ochraceum]